MLVFDAEFTEFVGYQRKAIPNRITIKTTHQVAGFRLSPKIKIIKMYIV